MITICVGGIINYVSVAKMREAKGLLREYFVVMNVPDDEDWTQTSDQGSGHGLEAVFPVWQRGQPVSVGSGRRLYKGGNDLIMPGSQEDIDEIIRFVGAAEGEVPYPLTMAKLQGCAKRIRRVLLCSSVYEA